MTLDKQRKQAARARAATTGESYNRAARLTADPGDRVPAIFSADRAVEARGWAQLLGWLDVR